MATRVTEAVIAVRRGEGTIPNPDASFEIEAGDRLVTIRVTGGTTAVSDLVATGR